MFRRFIAAAALLLLAGCTYSSNEVVRSSTPPAEVRLNTGALYVYSFLDLRDALFGPTMLTALNRQLTEKLSAAGVKAKVLTFKDSEIGRYFPGTAASSNIPVEKVIAANAADEAAIGARYRLIIFPQSTQAQGAWFAYEVSWELVDIATNKPVWTVKTQGRRLVMWTTDEQPEGRAATVLDAFFAEIKKAKLL